MPLLRTSASDVTAFRRVNATNQPVPESNIRSAAYDAPIRAVIPAIARASLAAKGVSPGNCVLGTGGGGPAPPPYGPTHPTDGPFGGSLQFSGSSCLKLTQITQDVLSPGTGDFTIEWWQYLDTSKSFPRVFSIGTEPTFAVSVEFPSGGYRTLYVWINGSFYGSWSVSVDQTWVHIAIVRINGVVTGYLNGVSLGSFTPNEGDIVTGTDELYIGTKIPGGDAQEFFEGYITNFSWTVGNGIYTSNFQPPMGNLAIVPGSKIILRANDEPSKFINTVPGVATVVPAPGSDIVWSPNTP